jgi:ubiquinone/menaquinone biosynthesis C-methylase UbiE
VKPTKADVAHQFGSRSQAYATSPTHAGGADLQMLIEGLDLEPQMKALDVATGAGHTAMAVAPRVRQVTAIDLAPEMIEQTRRLATERGLTNLQAMVMDCEALAFPDASFDVVTCRIAPHHFLEVDAAVREIYRVLRPGGRFGLEDTISPADPALDAFLNEVEKLRDPTHLRNYTEAEWRAMLDAAGFEVRSVRLYRKSHDVAEWIERSGVGREATERVYGAFAAASDAARKYFEIECQGRRAVRFTADQMIFRADKGN